MNIKDSFLLYKLFNTICTRGNIENLVEDLKLVFSDYYDLSEINILYFDERVQKLKNVVKDFEPAQDYFSEEKMAVLDEIFSALRERDFIINDDINLPDDIFDSGNVIVKTLSIPLKDEAYKQKLRPYVIKFEKYIKGFDKDNPYGVPIGLGNWAGVNMVLNFGIAINYAHLYYPDIIGKDEIYRVANWLFGCHPYHNYSFVAAVGAARPKAVFYGNNRADFSFIPGNVAPGLLFRKPDHFENFDDWPFLWGQNEGTIAGNTQYVIFGSAFKNLVNK